MCIQVCRDWPLNNLSAQLLVTSFPKINRWILRDNDRLLHNKQTNKPHTPNLLAQIMSGQLGFGLFSFLLELTILLTALLESRLWLHHGVVPSQNRLALHLLTQTRQEVVHVVVVHLREHVLLILSCVPRVYLRRSLDRCRTIRTSGCGLSMPKAHIRKAPFGGGWLANVQFEQFLDEVIFGARFRGNRRRWLACCRAVKGDIEMLSFLVQMGIGGIEERFEEVRVIYGPGGLFWAWLEVRGGGWANAVAFGVVAVLKSVEITCASRTWSTRPNLSSTLKTLRNK